MIAKEPKYISLKQAAELSGYSADYVGQLIRGGKLPGKQVFSNVAWMTTEEALHAYINKENKAEIPEGLYARVKDSLFSVEGLSRMYAYSLWVAIGILCIVALFLLYVLAVSIDHQIEARYLQSLKYDR